MHFFQFALSVIAIIVGGGVVTAFIKTAMVASGKSDQDAKKFELTEDLIKSGLFDTFPRRVTCEGLREIAIVGGKWEFEGPNPD